MPAQPMNEVTAVTRPWSCSLTRPPYRAVQPPTPPSPAFASSCEAAASPIAAALNDAHPRPRPAFQQRHRHSDVVPHLGMPIRSIGCDRLHGRGPEDLLVDAFAAPLATWPAHFTALRSATLTFRQPKSSITNADAAVTLRRIDVLTMPGSILLSSNRRSHPCPPRRRWGTSIYLGDWELEGRARKATGEQKNVRRTRGSDIGAGFCKSAFCKKQPSPRAAAQAWRSKDTFGAPPLPRTHPCNRHGGRSFRRYNEDQGRELQHAQGDRHRSPA